ncbi:hypothetical protein TNCV_234881 [Trichonephila clavipes]|uniref:Uncharacterized protein n=1 Tax=Trichonephila clavipes TaxID=2585209 RepID=A0A8X6SNZ5_TRICX|nr:hypothetical protein TNCV_234881 [Trichonephila clavipes]
MVKFIDFGEVWFLRKSVARVATIVGGHRFSHASSLIHRHFKCVLGVQQTNQLPYVAKVDLVWQLGVDICGTASRVDHTMDALRTNHSAVNDIEWCAKTLNDALQTQCCAMVRDVTERFVTAMRTICLSSLEVVH